MGQLSIILNCEVCGKDYHPLSGGSRKYCSMQCYNSRRCSTPEERFWARVVKSDGCWNWTGRKTRFGYGRLWVGGKDREQIVTHRASWIIHFGPIPEGKWVLHKCDNPACVRPDHLYLGTARENVADREERNRWCKKIKDTPHARGEKIGASKLTEDQVREMRARYAAGGMSFAALGRAYGVSDVLAGQVIRRQLWTHVP
jgi:hypothetical protein